MAKVLYNNRIVERSASDFPPAPPPTVMMVKQEAGRRILAIAPEWKQRNMLARSAGLLRIGEANLTQEQRDEALAIELVWQTIQMVRVRSNLIEAMDPIPPDYTDDKYWT